MTITMGIALFVGIVLGLLAYFFPKVSQVLYALALGLVVVWLVLQLGGMGGKL